MSLFDDVDTTTEFEASPEDGQEVETAVETPEDEQQPEIIEQDETGEEQEQETEEGEPSGDDEPEQGEMILGKFKSVDDLAKAYKNLERQFHASRQQQRQPATTQTPAPLPGGEEHPNDIVQRAFATDPIGTIQYFVQQALAPYQEQRESEMLTRNMETISKQYAKQLGTEGGMQAYFDKIAEIAQELGNPALIRNPSPRVLRMAAEELWGTETRQAVYDRAKAAGRQEAETARAAKRGLQAPAGARPQQQPVSEEDAIRQAILAAGRGGGGLLD